LWNSVAVQGKLFSSPEHPDQLWAPPSFLVSMLLLGFKWLGSEAEH